jgi:hypothetical protein
MKLAQVVAAVLEEPFAQAHYFTQFVESLLGQLAGRRIFLRRELSDTEGINRIGLGAL